MPQGHALLLRLRQRRTHVDVSLRAVRIRSPTLFQGTLGSYQKRKVSGRREAKVPSRSYMFCCVVVFAELDFSLKDGPKPKVLQLILCPPQPLLITDLFKRPSGRATKSWLYPRPDLVFFLTAPRVAFSQAAAVVRSGSSGRSCVSLPAASRAGFCRCRSWPDEGASSDLAFIYGSRHARAFAGSGQGPTRVLRPTLRSFPNRFPPAPSHATVAARQGFFGRSRVPPPW